MKKTKAYFLYMLLLSVIVCACNNNLDIQQAYKFDWKTMPVQKKVIEGGTVKIDCELIEEGKTQQTKYTIRYFQTEGKGSLKLNGQTFLMPNKRYSLEDRTFNLCYTSLCSEQQRFDVYLEDNFGQMVQKTFEFQHESRLKEEPVNENFTLTFLPTPKQILFQDTVEIISCLKREDSRNIASFSVRYFQPEGKGLLILDKHVPMRTNQLYKLNCDTFKLYYISDSRERQVIDIYVVDSHGKTVKKTLIFDNQSIPPEPKIDISFQLITLPIAKRIAQNETVEIRCRLKKSDPRNQANYSLRYFQPDGKGELRLDDGTVLKPNDLYPLYKKIFRLYYTSYCEEQQTIDVYIEDSHDQTIQKTFIWQNNKGEDKENEDGE